jgi:hypothetical protein
MDATVPSVRRVTLWMMGSKVRCNCAIAPGGNSFASLETRMATACELARAGIGVGGIVGEGTLAGARQAVLNASSKKANRGAMRRGFTRSLYNKKTRGVNRPRVRFCHFA